MPAEDNNVSTLFDCNLPGEINERIIHFLSYRPSSMYPKCYVDANYLIAVISASAELRSAALNKFRSVSAEYLAVNKKDSTVSRIQASRDRQENPSKLYVQDRALLQKFLVALGSTLHRLSIHVSSFSYLEWKRVASPINELSLLGVGAEFPLANVLEACVALRRLEMIFDDSDYVIRHHLECVIQNASRITELKLDGVKRLDGCADVWPRLECLENLSIKFEYDAPLDPIDTVYEGIAHPNSRVRKLRLLIWPAKGEEHLFAALHLCQALGHRLQELKLYIMNFELDTDSSINKFGLLKEACPQVSVSLICPTCLLLPVIQTMRDSLVEVRDDQGSLEICTPDLADFGLCTKLRKLTLNLEEPCAVSCSDLLLSHVGPKLSKLDLTMIPTFPRTSSSKPSLFIERVARYTGNLHHLDMGFVLPKVSYRPIAVSNPELRGLFFSLAPDSHCDGRHDVENWVVKTVQVFLANCLHLEDIVIEDHLGEDNINSSLFPQGIRITALDEFISSLRLRRKVAVRVQSTYYDA